MTTGVQARRQGTDVHVLHAVVDRLATVPQ